MGVAAMLDRPAIEGGTPVRPKDRFLVFGAPDLGEAEIAGVVDCMRRRWIGTGPKTQQFELDFAAYKGTSHAVAVGSCTAALHLSMLALGIGPGDEVITTSMTFASSVTSIVHTGATPVLVDCDASTGNITAQAIADRITERTKAVLVVHLYGRSCEMTAITALARARGLLLVEDCAHAIETSYLDRPAGTFGDVGCFSFYVTKNITTGEGGMVITSDENLAARIKILALHGMTRDAWKRFSDEGYRHYEVVEAGWKCNMTDMQAAIGIEQLKRVDSLWQRRQAVWNIYNEAFENLPCSLPPSPPPQSRHAYHLYTPLLDLERLRVSRDHILSALTAENIGVGVHYLPVHGHPYYRLALRSNIEYPNAERIGRTTLSLPLAGNLDDDDVDAVCTALRRVLTYYHA